MRWLFLALLSVCKTIAQPIGNEWIRPDQSYFKIPIVQTDRYQLTPDHLRRAGMDLTLLDPRTLQVFHRGREQAVLVTGEADGRFDQSDVLLFDGQANDGVPDSALYRPASAQPHPFYSLFSDTTYYFLTWRAGIRGLRDSSIPNPATNPILAESRVVLTTDYPAGTIYPLGATHSNGTILSYYDEGEGWTGPVVTAGKTFSVTVPLTGVVWPDSLPLANAGLAVRLEGWLVGRNAGPHRIAWWVNGIRVGESVFENYQTGRFSTLLNKGLALNSTGPDALTVTIEPLGFGESMSLSAVRVLFSRRTFLETSPISAPELRPVRFRVLDGKPANFLIVTHPKLRQRVGNVPDPVRAYATYRASLSGGSYDTLTVNSEELYNAFNYGERSPLAIRQFVRYMLAKANPNKPSAMLFLVGQSRDPQGVRRNPNAPLLDLVPNGGWPGSDVLLVEGLNGEARDVPGIPVGRLNTDNPQAVLDYLAKVREYEVDPHPQLWRKRVLHLSGGRSVQELAKFRAYVDGFSATARRAPFGALVQTRTKQTTEPVESVPIAPLVNEGVSLLTIFGHSGLDVTDVDIGFVTDDRRDYRNRGRYPFLLVNGCAAGNVFFGRPTFGTDWVTAPGRGAIGFLAHTYNGFPTEMRTYSDAFYSTLNDPRWQTEPVGRVQQETIRRYLRENHSIIDRANAQQFLLQADPAIRLFPFDKPDYAFGQENQLITKTDSLFAQVVVTNAGRAVGGPLPLRVRQYTPEGRLLNEQQLTLNAPLATDSLTLRLPRSTTGTTLLELRLNPESLPRSGGGQLPEYAYDNNTLILGGNNLVELPFPPDNIPPLLEVAFDGRVLENEGVVSTRPLISLRVLDENLRLLRRDTLGILLYLQRPEQAQTGAFSRLSLRSSTTQTDGRAFRIDYQPAQPLPDGRYQLEAYASDLSGNRAAPYRIGFRVQTETSVTAGVGPNPNAGLTRFFCNLTGPTPPETLRLTLTNALGQPVRTVVLPARIGLNEWIWNGTDGTGQPLPAGVYFYQFVLTGGNAEIFTAQTTNLTGRVLLIR